MTSKHSHDESEQGKGVHVVKNEPSEDEQFGKGQFTEKGLIYQGTGCVKHNCVPCILGLSLTLLHVNKLSCNLFV